MRNHVGLADILVTYQTCPRLDAEYRDARSTVERTGQASMPTCEAVVPDTLQQHHFPVDESRAYRSSHAG